MDACAVICPILATTPQHVRFLYETAASLVCQSDDAWNLYLVDDGSPLPDFSDLTSDLRRNLGGRLRVLEMTKNGGQGKARNVAASLAAQNRLDYCVYLDADDLADPKRVEVVRRIFGSESNVDFIYSAFDLIDEHGKSVPKNSAVPSIQEILNCFDTEPPSGREAWSRIVADTGYVTLTSTVSVRTSLALAQPFPLYFVSEDQHAWLRMTAASTGVAFDKATRCRYRINSNGAGSSVRNRIGTGYYEQKAWVDANGFFTSLPIALANGLIEESDVPSLAAKFLIRCALTLEAEGLNFEAEYYRAQSCSVAQADCHEVISTRLRMPQMFHPHSDAD